MKGRLNHYYSLLVVVNHTCPNKKEPEGYCFMKKKTILRAWDGRNKKKQKNDLCLLMQNYVKRMQEEGKSKNLKMQS